jgi:hypothetical protein
VTTQRPGARHTRLTCGKVALRDAAVSRERSEAFEHRSHLLAVNHRYAQRFLELQLEWLDEAERAFAADRIRRP